MKKTLPLLVVLAAVVPQVVLAVWWNPFTWFKKAPPQRAPEVWIVQQAEDENIKEATTTVTTITSTGRVVKESGQPKAQEEANSTGRGNINVNTLNAKSVAAPSSPTPPELVGIWLFDNMYGLGRDGGMVVYPLERIPQGLQVLKITNVGFCHDPRHETAGDEMGMLCKKYLPASFSGTSIKFNKESVWVELFEGFKVERSFTPRQSWPKPTAYKVTGDTLEFIVKSEDGTKDLWVYKFHKHPVVYTGGPLTMQADRQVVNPGEDIVLSGTAPTGSVIRIFSETPSYWTENCTAKGYCSSPPIVVKGKRFPNPPGTDEKALSLEEKYFDCPWPETQIETPEGVFAYAHLCVIPDETGAFAVKLFNPGVNTRSSADQYEATYYAKLANEPITKSVKATILTCKKFPKTMSCGYGKSLQRP